jgi:hypothetical protein
MNHRRRAPSLRLLLLWGLLLDSLIVEGACPNECNGRGLCDKYGRSVSSVLSPSSWTAAHVQKATKVQIVLRGSVPMVMLGLMRPPQWIQLMPWLNAATAVCVIARLVAASAWKGSLAQLARD